MGGAWKRMHICTKAPTFLTTPSPAPYLRTDGEWMRGSDSAAGQRPEGERIRRSRGTGLRTPVYEGRSWDAGEEARGDGGMRLSRPWREVCHAERTEMVCPPETKPGGVMGGCLERRR